MRSLSLAMTIAIAGCGEAGPGGEPELPLAISGSPAATDTVGAAPVQGLVVDVRDPSGALSQGKTVRFTAIPATRKGVPTVSMLVAVNSNAFGPVAMATTNDRGRAVALVKFGSVAGPGGIEIAVPEFRLIDTVSFTIVPGNLAAVRLEPGDTVVAIGATVAIRSGVVDRVGNPRSDPISFSTASIPTGAGTVTPAGQVSVSQAGQVRVIGAAADRADTVTLSVVPAGKIVGYDALTRRFVETNLDGSGERPLSDRLDPSSLREPAWSPDGTAIAFEHLRRLWILSLATGAITAYPNIPDGYWPAFSPDAQQIYFTAADDDTRRIARINRDGSGFTVLTPGRFDGRPSVSSDGKTLVYETFAGGSQIAKYDLVSGTVQSTLRPGYYPEWSPAGDRIAYFSEQGGIRLMNPDGSNDQSLLSEHVGVMDQLSWSPDGRWLLAANQGMIEIIGVAAEVRGVVIRRMFTHLDGVIWRP
ncbi:MAG: hypothetical protein SFV24_25610 [Gemmatimonadales bacterium]|nr:hypothetical protein [Gemmatimonadales bacterium]